MSGAILITFVHFLLVVVFSLKGRRSWEVIIIGAYAAAIAWNGV